MKHTAKHIVGYRYNDDGFPREYRHKSSYKPKKPITKTYVPKKLKKGETFVYIELRIASKYNYADFVEYYKKGGIPVYTIDPQKIGSFSFRPHEYVSINRHIEGNRYFVLPVSKEVWEKSDDKLKLLSSLYPKKKYSYLYKFEHPKSVAKRFTGIKRKRDNTKMEK